MKIAVYALWHSLQLQYKFRGDSRSSFEIMYTFAFFVVVSLLSIVLKSEGWFNFHVGFTNVDKMYVV